MPGSVTLPSSTLVLGPWRIDRITIGGPISVREGTTGLFFMPDNRPMRADDGTAVDARADDLVILPTGGSLCGIGQSNRACTRLSAPRPFLAPALPHRSRVVILRRSGSVDALRCHVERLRAIKADMLDTEQVKAAACSIRELLTAAMMPVTHVRKGGAERENALLDRILEHVDATLGSDVSIASLCKALACSRSALYRAAAPRGGLIKIVIRQRLMAVHGALGQHGDNDRSPRSRACTASSMRAISAAASAAPLASAPPGIAKRPVTVRRTACHRPPAQQDADVVWPATYPQADCRLHTADNVSIKHVPSVVLPCHRLKPI